MKLLLTSTGLTHPDIVKAFFGLVGKPPEKIKVAFVPTAAITSEESNYVLESKTELVDLGIKDVINIDLKTTPERDVLSCDVMYACGGNTFHLLNEVRRYRFDEIIRKFINLDKLYLGVSAGSILVTPSIEIVKEEPADANSDNVTDFKGLGLVDFEVSPHSPEIVSFDTVDKYVSTRLTPLIRISNKTAIKVDDKRIDIIGDKEFKKYRM